MTPPQLAFAGPHQLFPPSPIKRPYIEEILREEQKEFLSFRSKSRGFKGGNPSSGWPSWILQSGQQGGRQQPKAKRTPRLRYNLVFPSEVKYDTNRVVNNTHDGQNPADVDGLPRASNALEPSDSPSGNKRKRARGASSDTNAVQSVKKRSKVDGPAHTAIQFNNIPSPARLPTVQSAGATPDRKRSREQSSFPEADDEGRARKRRYPGSASVLEEVPVVPQVLAPEAIMVPQDHKRPGHVEESKGASPLELPTKFSAEKLDFPTFEEETSVADLISVGFDQLAAEALPAPQETEEGSMRIQETTAPESNTIQEPATPRYTFELPSSNLDQSEDWFLNFLEEDSYQH
ncbi:hypothetical protein MMC29_006754 [Sticta canariensis]|nr:hypothetical protein [Sticta canariensis]